LVPEKAAPKMDNNQPRKATRVHTKKGPKRSGFLKTEFKEQTGYKRKTRRGLTRKCVVVWGEPKT